MSECIFCNKIVLKNFSLNRHYKTCKKISLYKEIIDSIYNNELLIRIDELESEIVSMQEQYNTDKVKEISTENILLKEEVIQKTIEIAKLNAINEQQEKTNKNEISRLMHLINNNKQVIHTTNNIVHNNTNTQNIGHKYVMNEFSPLKQQFIDEEMQGINLRNTNRPLEELSNHVNKSRIGLNFYVKDRSRKQIVYLDEESNESNDTTKLGEQIYRSIIDHVNDILYSEHKRSNKVYRKQIEQLSKNCTDTYNKIISDCIKFAKSPDQIKTIQDNLKDKFKQLKELISDLIDSYEPENNNLMYHFKYGIDAIICFVCISIKEFITIKNGYLYIKANTDNNEIIEIKDSEKYIQAFIYESLIDNSKSLIKASKKLKKQYADFEEIIQETIDYLSSDKKNLKDRIDSKIRDLESNYL